MIRFFYIFILINLTSAFKLSEVESFFALGDSLVSGFGIIHNDFTLLDEYRGLSGFAGCDKNAITFPNLLKAFATNITGCSMGQHLVEICYNVICPNYQRRESDYNNMAQSGAMVLNLDNQVSDLLSRYKNNPSVKKLGILVIGANDACLSDVVESDYLLHFRSIFSRIMNELPNTYLIAFPFFHISQIYNLSKKTPGCSIVNHILSIECSSAFLFPSKYLPSMDKLIDDMNDAIHTVAKEINDNPISIQNKMHIEVKSIFEGQTIENFPPDFISTVDCFHVSLYGHQNFAINMWNSLFGNTNLTVNAEPIKGYDFDLFEETFEMFL